MKTIILSLLLLLSTPVYGSIEVLQDYLAEDQYMGKVRNHANLWQGYIHTEDEATWVFHALIDDDEITYWSEEPVFPVNVGAFGQAADVTTTGIGLAIGLSEGNPLGILPTAVLKLYTVAEPENLPANECKEARAWNGATGYGAAASNITTMIAGTFAWPSVLIGLAVGAIAYKPSKELSGCYAWAGPVVAETIEPTDG